MKTNKLSNPHHENNVASKYGAVSQKKSLYTSYPALSVSSSHPTSLLCSAIVMYVRLQIKFPAPSSEATVKSLIAVTLYSTGLY